MRFHAIAPHPTRETVKTKAMPLARLYVHFTDSPHMCQLVGASRHFRWSERNLMVLDPRLIVRYQRASLRPMLKPIGPGRRLGPDPYGSGRSWPSGTTATAVRRAPVPFHGISTAWMKPNVKHVGFALLSRGRMWSWAK